MIAADKRKGKKSAIDAEQDRLADEHVESALKADQDEQETGTRSVLPGPPIPPDRQQEIRTRQEAGATANGEPDSRTGSAKSKKAEGGERRPMIETDKIKEHMEVVGSDGAHVGTVDRCEEQERIKLTKSDPAAHGEHKFIPLDWVSRVDRQVHLARPGAEVLRQLG